VSAQT